MNRLVGLLCAALLLSACGDKKKGANVTITGRVSAQSQGTMPQPLSGAAVRATVGGGNRGATESADEGVFTLHVKAKEGDNVVIRFESDGYATAFRTIRAAPGANLNVSVSLRQLDPLACNGADCALAGNRLTLAGLPDGFSGSARVFNPVAEADAFPGAFGDDQGNLLLSGVFAAIEMEDGNGDDVEQLGAPADLRMAVPRDTWGIVVDIQIGNGTIDVPMYAFNEASGEWIREGQGVLQNEAGTALTEADLPSVRDGSFAGVLFASASVQHFSYWNVDWPIETHACLSGRLVDENGNPAAGATVTLTGLTYNGTSQPVTVGADGRFCIDAMRSEAAGEDVDNDGILGETQRVAIRIFHNGALYDGGAHDMPITQGTCPDNCLDLGDVTLQEASKLQAALCTITGKVRRNATPVANVNVYGWDDTMPPEIYTQLCSGGGCAFLGTTNASGDYTIVVPVVGGAQLWAFTVETPEAGVQVQRWGGRNVIGCPVTPSDISLSDGYEYAQLTVTFNANVISWTPARDATQLFVLDAGGAGYDWLIFSDTGFPPPVTYGTIPAGAEQAFPTGGGAPAAPGTGDLLYIYTAGTTSDGLPSFGAGQLPIP